MPVNTMDIVRGDPGTKLDRSQQRSLGEGVLDTLGRRWRYTRFDVAVGFGELVRDSNGTDLIGATRTVSGAVAAGARTLLDQGVFTETVGNSIRGAIGIITAGTGIGQTFIITDRIANNVDEMRIACLCGRATPPSLVEDYGWTVALDGTSVYELLLPGAARRAVDASNHLAGFVQRDVLSGDVGRFGYVLQKGPGFGVLDFNGTPAPTNGGDLTPSAGGTLIGAGSTVPSNRRVARCLLGDLPVTADSYIPIEATIENEAMAYRMASYAHPIDQFLDIR